MRILFENTIYEAVKAKLCNRHFEFVTVTGEHYSLEVRENIYDIEKVMDCLGECGFIKLETIVKKDTTIAKLMKIGEAKK